MSDIVKHVLKFKEARRTVYLAAAGKDTYGRHRGHVQYGMKLTPVGRYSVHIGPGALYTAFGTRLYLDLQSSANMTLDLSDTSVINLNTRSIFNSAGYDKWPLVVAIVAKFDAYGASDPADLPQSKQVESEADVQVEVSFVAKLVSWDRATLNPAFNIIAQDPIFMNKGVQSDAILMAAEYGTRNNYADDSVTAAIVDKQAGAIKLDEIVLGYLILGTPLGSATPTVTLESASHSGQWADGVACVQVKNSWEALEDFLGADVLFGRADKLVMSSPNGISALNQLAGVWNIGPPEGEAYNTGPLMLSPKFGTTGVTDGAFQAAHQNYRLPSFMRDGDNLINVLRRVDYFLRLWMDRTGDQALISQIQDGLATGQTVMSPLLNMLQKFDGSDSPTTNLNAAKFRDGGMTASNPAPDADPHNTVLKSGVLPHTDEQKTDINSILLTNYADTHYGALRAMDVCIGNILNNIFGLSVSRSRLRTTDDWTIDGIFTDLPIGLTEHPTNPWSSDVAFPYAGSVIKKIIPTINQLLYRSERPIGENLLQNAGFWAGADQRIVGWRHTGGINDVAIGKVVMDGSLMYVNITHWVNGRVFYQVIQPDAFRAFYYAKTAGIVSASLMLSNDIPLVMKLSLSSEEADRDLAVITIPGQDTPRPRTVALSADLSSLVVDETETNYLKLSIWNLSGTAGLNIKLYGAAVNAGMPNPCPVSRLPMDFLSRDGGVDAPMRGNLFMGGSLSDLVGGSLHDIYFGSTINDVMWLPGPNVVTNYSGVVASTQELEKQPVYQAIDVLNQRTMRGVGPNLLHNPTGCESSSSLQSGDQGAMPPNWYTTGTSLQWWMNPYSIGSASPYHMTRFFGTGPVYTLTSLPNIFQAQDLLGSAGLVSASAFVTNRSGNPLKFVFSLTHGGSTKFQIDSNIIPGVQTLPGGQTGLMTVTLKISDLSFGFENLQVMFQSANGDPGIDFDLYEVSVNTGMPRSGTGFDSMRVDYVPRCGGPNHAMTGALQMGNTVDFNGIDPAINNGGSRIEKLAPGRAGSHDAVRMDQLPPPPTAIIIGKCEFYDSSMALPGGSTFGFWNSVRPNMTIQLPAFAATWAIEAFIEFSAAPDAYLRWRWLYESPPHVGSYWGNAYPTHNKWFLYDLPSFRGHQKLAGGVDPTNWCSLTTQLSGSQYSQGYIEMNTVLISDGSAPLDFGLAIDQRIGKPLTPNSIGGRSFIRATRLY